MVTQQPFTLALDGSNDQEEQKLVPLANCKGVGMVKSQFIDMTLCSAGTAAAYFEKVEEVISIPWCNCVGFSVDSASVNVGAPQLYQN